MTLYESSSGNTAKALAMLSAEREGINLWQSLIITLRSVRLIPFLAYGSKLHFCTEKENAKGSHLVDVRRYTAKKISRRK